MSSDLSRIGLNWKAKEFDKTNRVAQIDRRTNWNKLCERASNLRGGLHCQPLNHTTNGFYNLVRLLEFADGTLWVARINLSRSVESLAILESEIHVMQLLKARSCLPVPEIFAYEVNENNDVCVPFILMEFIPGNTAMNAAGGYDEHRGRILAQHRPTFYRSVAQCHLQMTALRFPKIGTIVRAPNGQYDVGPLPHLGGPFYTATQFFEAWAKHAKFPRDENDILRGMRNGPVEKVVGAIREFPSQILALASRLSEQDHGPFPLCHGDFIHSNMIVNDHFDVTAIIDWEGSRTLPLELVAFPGFLNILSAQFGSSDRYDEEGLPLDEEERQRWNDRKGYVEMVREFEGTDNVLSTCLSNKKGLALGYLISSYENGKLGFYDEVMREHFGEESEGI
ncbi:protein kinase-like protein [Pochonia chlamydosporia 170]|uniref:Protein kinase-like protein n=1 Tax=Pochonia chlamydosporia 170 TaxID=1380566 RepID=A0A179FQH8_METCM|nr:protein kinase-like protein [Pochonia chlamydosporia 170]OAQ67617.1 protein kinase-like protein [Pochonia chlamydosporia 170]